MNTGIQDAYNLAWKLALVIKQKAKPAILESFHLERYPVVKGIVRKTNSLTNMMIFDKNFFHELHKFSKALVKKGKAKKIAEEVTQLSIAYKKSPIINYDILLQKHSPNPGERAPDLKINGSKRLYNYFSNDRHNILIFVGKEKNITKNLIKIREKLSKKFSCIANIFFISKVNIDEENIIVDENYHLYDAYHIKNKAVYIIRPDNYIGYFSEELDVEKIETFFNVYLAN